VERDPVRIAEYLKQWYAQNTRKHRALSKQWKKGHPTAVKEANKKYRDATKDKQAAYYVKRCEDPEYVHQRKLYNANWRKKNKGLCTSYVNQRRAARLERTPLWLTDDDHWLMQEAYVLAAMRTKMLGFPWHVDHIEPLRGKNASGLHVPWNLQVIPGVDNLRKGNRR
jgi:hypothetical protein